MSAKRASGEIILSDDAVTLAPGKRPFSLPPRKTLIRLAIVASPWALYVVWTAAGVANGVFFTTMERLNNGASVLPT